MAQKLTAEQWRRISRIVDGILALPEAERAARLQEASAEDPELGSQITTLLAAGDGIASAQADGLAGSASRALRFLPGTVLAGRYRIATRLGRGGMGAVFRADDLKLGQAVALKFLPKRLADDDELNARLLNEVKLARRIAHPNVCRVYDIGEADGQLFLSMEFIDGEDLASLLKRIGRLPKEKATQIGRQLCAGLAAAHEQGILHRDLKPANVMLDDRGRVRITDFGLAGLADEIRGGEVLTGTPAYMAPEQLAGESVSIQSDLYSLGLLLYELFTGQRAFEAESREKLLELQRDTAPSALSSRVEGLDATVERAILRCLEPDPSERPRSTRELAVALPGGDPLAAAVAAGETPSPEMVAAAGPDGRLRPRTLGLLLGLTAAALGIVAYLAPRASVIGIVPVQKPVAALVENARQILARLGYDQQPGDHAFRLSPDRDYLRYLVSSDRSPSRWQPLTTPGQVYLRFEYRQSPRPLVPGGWTGRVTGDNPPAREGDISIVTDLRGRLRALRVVPPASSQSDEALGGADWPALFDAAGLDLGAFRPTTPKRQPGAFVEVRAAWLGALPEIGLPVRIEAGATRARPTFFECVLPSSPDGTGARSGSFLELVGRSGGGGLPGILWSAFLLAVLGLPVLLALRNVRLGRGDRRGATRLAAVVFGLRLLWWVLGGHHARGLWAEIELLFNAIARSLFVAAVAWILYMAVESYARRLWPGVLISWSRLLAGRTRDPLVGRDLLLGVAYGLLSGLFAGVLYFLIPTWLAWPEPPIPVTHPFWPFFAPFTDPLLGAPIALAAIASSLMGAVWLALSLLAVLIGLLAFVRRKWLALSLFVLLVGPNTAPALWSGHSWLGIALGFLWAGLFCWIFVRFGLLAALAGVFTTWVVGVFPITTNPTAHYFGLSLFALAIVAALAAFGAWTSIGRPPTRAKAGY